MLLGLDFFPLREEQITQDLKDKQKSAKENHGDPKYGFEPRQQLNLDELKKVQEKYVQVTQKEADFNKLAQYMQLQDQKIIQLQTVIMQMQKEFSTVLQNQQSQINQLQQSSYY